MDSLQVPDNNGDYLSLLLRMDDNEDTLGDILANVDTQNRSIQRWQRPPKADQPSTKHSLHTGDLAQRPSAMGTVKRRKVEMEKLHRLEQQLRKRLAQLKVSAEENAKLSSMEQAHNSNLPTICDEAAISERTRAEEESKCRHLAVQENAKLRNTMEHQLRVMKSLRRLLQRRMRQETMKAATAIYNRQQLLSAIAIEPYPHSDPVFDRILEGLDEIYAGVDVLFKKVKLHDLPCPGRQNIAHENPPKFVEFLDCYGVPFGIRQTERAVWRCLGQLTWKGPKSLVSSHFDKARNAMMATWITSFTTGNTTVAIKNWRVTRKYVERHRTVFVSRAYVEPNVSPFPVFYEIMRFIVTEEGVTDLGTTSVIRSHREATRHDKNDHRRIIQTYDAIGVVAWDIAVTDFNHCVEDALLQDKLTDSMRMSVYSE